MFLANMLETHLATLPADPNALLFTAPGGGNGRTDGDGGLVRHGLFVRRVSKRAVRASLPADKHDLRWHDLRDTCASLLIHNGVSILLVSKRLGHAAATMTLDRYGWLYPSAEVALTDALDATYDGANVTPLRREEAA